MIPFARILNYGNVVEKPAIVSFKTNRQHRAVVYENGFLYTSGYGSNYKLGTGNTTNMNNTWALADTDVVDVFLGINSTLILKSDGTYWHCGLRESMYGSTGVNITWTNVTNLFNAIPSSSPIKTIRIGGSSTVVLTEAGELFGIGTTTDYTLGTNLAKTSFFLIDTGVSTISYSYTSLWYIKNGIVYRAGMNTSGNLGNGSTTATIMTFTEYTNPANSICIDVQSDEGMTSLLIKNTTTNVVSLYNCGYGWTQGRGSSSATTTFAVLPGYNNIITSFFNEPYNTSTFFFKGIDGIYSGGTNVGGVLGIGNTSTSTVYARTIGLPSIEDVIRIQAQGSFITFALCTNNRVYWTGQASYAYPGATNTSTFIPMQMPI